MPPAPIPKNDANRLDALARYQILDTQAEEVFDRIAKLAKQSFEVPIALISLVDADRQWFKSRQGLDLRETARDRAFCGYTILQRDVLVVEDASMDDRFVDNPLVTSEPNIRFYAGAPLMTPEGYALGSLCVIDTKPRKFLDVDANLLRNLANLAMNEIEFRVADGKNEDLERVTNRDLLSDTYNQSTFQKLYFAECARAHRYSAPLSLAVINLFQPDSLNEAIGAGSADGFVGSFRDICKAVTRSNDIVARMSATEFAILMPKTNCDSAEIVVSRILKRTILGGREIDGHPYSVSAGLAQLLPNQRPGELYAEATRNLGVARTSGPNKCIASRLPFHTHNLARAR
ncbi:MAG: GAF domain-containing protein [Alphaproteobacteria bacterium]|nr:GAF domain-containing protein [Alphaproteobacteria bacterium]